MVAAAAAACAPPLPPEDALAAPMLLLLLLLVLLFALLAAGATGAAAAERDAIKGQLPGAARLGGRRPWIGFARLRYVTLAVTYAKQGYPRSFFSGTRIKWRRSEFPGLARMNRILANRILGGGGEGGARQRECRLFGGVG